MDSAIRRVPSGLPAWIADFHVYGGLGEYKARPYRPTRCSGFCSDPTIKRTHPDTAAHIPFRELSVLFSEYLLRGKALREVALLFRDQEAGGSNPLAPTILSFVYPVTPLVVGRA